MRASVCLLLVLSAVPARAQRAESPTVEAAKGHFQAGKVYFQEGNLKRALAEFKEAARDADLPGLDYNIGLTYERLGDAARALAAYERYLARAGSAPDAPEVRGRIAGLQRSIGTLTIVSRVPGASFTLDEEPVDAATLNRPQPVTVGKHRLVASKDGYFARTTEVRVESQKSVEVELDPVLATAQQPAKEKKSRWWIGLVVGGVAVVAAGVTVGVVLGTRDTTPLYKGNIGTGIVEISP